MRGTKETQKNNKGITLIALIITIIVMLILVAVTITVAVNGGLFEYAGRASKETNEAIANENKLASGVVTVNNVGSETEGDINTIVNLYTSTDGTEEPPTLITFTVNGDTYEAEEGMTWQEWINSDYSKIYDYVNFHIEGTVVFCGGNPVWYSAHEYDDNYTIYPDTVIVNNESYIAG